MKPALALVLCGLCLGFGHSTKALARPRPRPAPAPAPAAAPPPPAPVAREIRKVNQAIGATKQLTKSLPLYELSIGGPARPAVSRIQADNRIVRRAVRIAEANPADPKSSTLLTGAGRLQGAKRKLTLTLNQVSGTTVVAAGRRGQTGAVTPHSVTPSRVTPGVAIRRQLRQNAFLTRNDRALAGIEQSNAMGVGFRMLGDPSPGAIRQSNQAVRRAVRLANSLAATDPGTSARLLQSAGKLQSAKRSLVHAYGR